MMQSISQGQFELLEAMATSRTTVVVSTDWLVDFCNQESAPFRELIRMGLMQSVRAEDEKTSCLVLSELTGFHFNKNNQVSQRVH